MTSGQTLTERTRKQLAADASPEFTVSRMALETLVSDSERYGAINGVLNRQLLSARGRLREVAHSHDGRIVWEQVVAQLEAVAVADPA